MTKNRISIYIRLACMTAAVVWPGELFARRPAATSRPTTVTNRPAPDIEQLKRILKSRDQLKPGQKHGLKPGRMSAVPTEQIPTVRSTPESSKSQTVSFPTTLPAGEKMQFSFNNAPYSTVFDFIERISGLPILGERNVPGTLTYFSRKKMTVNEALEELNMLLSEKGVVLVRKDDHLRVAKFPDVLRTGSLDFIGAETFLKSDVSPNQIVRVFFRVQNLPADEITNLLAEALPVNEVKLAAWKTTNQIQVVGLASQVRKIIALARELDEKLRAGGEGLNVKVYKPKYVSPTVLERVLKTMVPESGVIGPRNVPLGEPGDNVGGMRQMQRPSEGGSIQIAADDMTGTLVVRANPGTMEQVNKIIGMLDVQEDAGNVKAVRIPVQFGSIQTIEMVLNESIRQRVERMGRSQLSLTVRGDEGTRSIVLAGSRSLVDKAEQMVKLLDKSTLTTKIQVISLRSAQAMDILNQVLSPFYRNARREVPAAADMISNSIITWATGTELEELKGLLKELDASAREGKGIPTIKTFRLEEGDINRLVSTLQAMFAQQKNVTFGADPASKTLIVGAPVEKMPQIEKIINEVKASLTDRVVTQLVKLKYANADQVTMAVKGAFSNRRQPTGEARIEISPSAQANSVLVSGIKTSVEEAVRLITQLDNQIQAASEIKTFKLSFAQSEDVVKMIQDLYGSKDPTLKVVADPWSNTLFISGGLGNISAIEQLIKTTDHTEPVELVSNNVAFITLKTASAKDVADQIQSGMTGMGKNAPSVEASESGNYLVVTGQPKQIDRIRKMAENIDKMALQIPEILAVRPIQKISAERLGQMLNAIVPQLSGTKVKLVDVNLSSPGGGLESFMLRQGQGSTTRPGASIISIGVDKVNNTLIIRGRPKDIDEIDKAIANLTTDIQDDVQFKIFPLKYAGPSDVAMDLETLFNDSVSGQPQVLPQMQPQMQPPQAQHRGQLAGNPQTARSQQTGPVRPQGAAGGRRIRAIPVEQTDSIVVRADPRDFQTIEEFIAQLDRPDTGNVKIFKLQYARADAVAKNITDIFRSTGQAMMRGPMVPGGGGGGRGTSDVNVSFDLASNSIIVTAGRAKCREIQKLIDTLDKPDGAGVNVHVLSLKSAKAEQVAPMIQNVLQQAEMAMATQKGLPPQNIAITFDKRTNSLIIAGNNRQFEQVKNLVDRLEAARPAGTRKIFVVPLKNLDPSQAKQILDQLLPAGGQSRLETPTGYPGIYNTVSLIRSRLALAQVRKAAATTRPAPKSPLMGNQPEKALRLTLLQQMMDSARKKEKSPAVAPTKSSGPVTRFPKSIVAKPAVAPGAKPEELSDVSTQQLKTLAQKIQGNVEITAVPDQNALIIDATDQDYQVVQQLLDLLDKTKVTAKVQIIKLKNARSQELAEVVGRIFTGRQLPKGYPPVSITPDLATNSLIVSASQDNVTEIEQIVKQLDAQEQVPQMDFRIYSLKNARASQLVPQLQDMLKQIMAARGITQVPFSITADDRTNTIIVTAPQTYLDQIGRLITTMDTVPSFATVEMDVVRLKQADADQMGKVLAGLVDPSLKRGTASELLTRLQMSLERAGEKVTLDLEKPIKYIADKPSQSILIFSTTENNRILRQIITMLDRVPLGEDVRVRVFPLKIAEAQDVRKTLEDIFSKGEKLTKVPGTEHNVGVPANPTGQAVVYNVSFAADKASNTVIASGQESSLALVEVLMAQLDSEQPGALYPIRTIGMKNADAKKLQKLIEEMIDARLKRAQALGMNRVSDKGKVVIRADDRINLLLVSASDDDFKMIQGLVKKLDSEPEKTNPPVLIHLKRIQAEEAGKLLETFFKERNQVKTLPTQTQPAFPATMPVIVPDPRSNTLIVSAGKATMTEVKDLINRLDTMAITRKMQVSIIPLHSADASQLAEAIMKVLNPSKDQTGLKEAVLLEFIRKTPEGKSLPQTAEKDQLFIYGDKTSNLLMAVAPAETIKLIESLVAYIDQVAPTVEIRVFALENADSTQMKKTLEELFAIGKTSQGPERVYFFNQAPEKGSKLEKEVLAVTADTRTNSVLVSGSSTYLKMIGKVIKDLDAKAIQQQKTEVIALKNAKADTVQKAVDTLIQNRVKMWQEVYGKEGVAPERLLEQQVNIVADTDSRKVILQASPRYFEDMKKIITELDELPPQVMIQALLIEVTLDGRIEYGFEAVGQDLSFTKNQTAPGIGPGKDYVVGTDIGAAGSGGPAGFTFAIHSEDFNLLLRALNSDGKLQVISRPQILAKDNAKASIQIGQKVPLPTSATVDQSTGAITPSITYEDVGVIVNVTPHINPDGFVSMEVAPEISSLSTSTVAITTGLNASIINKNKIDTTVTVKDGETVVIGGLITKRMEHRETKVPFFGDIPILCYAFKSVVDTETRSEILVVLTPKLMNTVDKARNVSEEERDMLELLPRDVRESRLMGKLRQTFDEDGCPTSQPATQPGEYLENGTPLFDRPPACMEQLNRALKRTCDQ
jgi:type II secretion system protein D